MNKMDDDLLSVQEARDLLGKAVQAQKAFSRFSQEETDAVVANIARVALENARELAELAVAETGFGRSDDKYLKNVFAAKNVAESIRPMKTAEVIAHDPERRIVEIAVPMGVVAGIIPTTNPTSTTIYKALISLKARNAVVFSPHPSARQCICRTAQLLHDAAVAAGAPDGIISCLTRPSMNATNELMQHRSTAVILATGGHALVKAAYSSGKPAFGVGPGNVPAFIERTADPAAAAEMILAGKCFDNGTVCASEQAVVVDREIEKSVREAFTSFGAYFCCPDERKKLERLMVRGGRLNPEIVGRSAAYIAGEAGFAVHEETPALIVELEKVGPEEPLSLEKLSPVLAYYQVDGWQAGCEKCLDILNYGGLGHTMVIHSKEDHIIMQFALEKPAFRILANTPGTHGAIGLSTGLTPSLTLGCGTWGNNITTDNITATHLMNVKRLAYGHEPVRFSRDRVSAVSESPKGRPTEEMPDRDTIRDLVRKALSEWKGSGEGRVAGSESGDTSPRRQPRKSAEAFSFVTESDVREARSQGKKIILRTGTRVTPLAQDLGEEWKIFIRES